MLKPTLKFRDLTELQVAKSAANILVKMTENVDLFPEPEPSLALLETALASFNRSLSDAIFRDMRQVVIKNQRLAALKLVMFNLSLYVTKIAQGNSDIILAAGFVPTKDPTPIGIGPKPTDFRASPLGSRPGEVDLRVKSWASATMYFFEYRKAQSTDPWARLSSTRSNIRIAGLDSLQTYEFRVAYATTDPRLTYSDVILSVVL